MGHKLVDPKIFLQHHQEAVDRTAGGLKSWKPKSAPAGNKAMRNTIRIMPPHENMDDVIIYFRQHFSLGPNADTAAPCLEFFNKPCPACQLTNDYFEQARQEKDPGRAKAYKDKAFDIRSKDRYACNIVDVAQPEAGVQPWLFGRDVHEALRQCFYDDNGEVRDVSHPETGRDLLVDAVKKAGTDFNEYPVFKAKESPSPLFDMELLNGITDLTELIYEPTVEEVQAALGGVRIQRKDAEGHVMQTRPGALSGTTPRATQAALPPATTATPPAQAAKPVGSGSTTPTARRPGPPRRGATAPAPASTATPPRVPRTPVTDSAPNGSGDFWAQSLALLMAQGVDPNANPQWARDLEKLATIPKPGCYKREFEVTDGGCQGCKVVLPCAAVVNGWVDPATV